MDGRMMDGWSYEWMDDECMDGWSCGVMGGGMMT